MKVEKILCDVCGEEINPKQNNGYKMSITSSFESCNFDGGEIDVCEKCISALRDETIKRSHKEFYAFDKIIKPKINVINAVWK